MTRVRPNLTDAFANQDESALCCPVCGNEFLYQVGVEVFSRDREDSETGQHVTVRYNSGVEIDDDTTTAAGNPSRRRDGIRMAFRCEHCHGDGKPTYQLVISQHKGNEFVSWDVPGGS